MIEYTFDHAIAADRLDTVVLTTDSAPALQLGRKRGLRVVERPAELADDLATVDSAARHAIVEIERQEGRTFDIAVLLYGNIPVRAGGVIDRSIEHLIQTGADSVRTVAPVSKHHPDWLHRLDDDRMIQYRANSIYRRQDLTSLYYHDGAVVVVMRNALFDPKTETDPQAFLGDDRRAIVQRPEEAVDVDTLVDLRLAEAIIGGQVGPSSVRVGGRAVGANQPPFVVAEAGVNHNGDIETALRMIEVAADAGADAVKFQVFSAGRLASTAAPTTESQIRQTGCRTQHDLLQSLELPDEGLERIAAHCRGRGVAFVATPFSECDVARIVSIGVDALKIASTDIVDHSLLECAATTGLPLILSTGAADECEIAEAVCCIRGRNAIDRLALLHCVSAYPTPLDQANLRAIGSLHALFNRPVGFSDHTTSTTTGALAVAAGACVLEKHFTLDRDATGPDHAMSLEPVELAEYVRLARDAHDALGDGSLDVQPIEAEVRLTGRKTIVAARPIPQGSEITRSDVQTKRVGDGITANFIHAVVGRRTNSAIETGTALRWELVQ